MSNTSEEMPAVVGSTTPGAADATERAHASSAIIADLDARVRGEVIVVMLEVNATSQGDVELSVEKGEILLKPLTTAVRFSKGRAAVLSLSSGRFYLRIIFLSSGLPSLPLSKILFLRDNCCATL